MNRETLLERARAGETWDVLVVGGGATGLGVAVDAASRGYRTCVLEQRDFGQGTSSRSTKLVHGGVRYLQQGNVSLVMEALKERGILRRHAPHLVHDLRFIVPTYDWWESPFYGIGMKVYDLLAGKYGFGRSKMLSRDETTAILPNLETEGLRGGVQYFDGQFDDARLLVHLARTAVREGAAVLNDVKVTALRKERGLVAGVEALDVESGATFTVAARVVVNATGPFADDVRHLDDARAPSMIEPSQGIHVVLPRAFLDSDSAIMVPHTSDDRVMFAIPWHDRVVVGTTDVPVDAPRLEPVPTRREIDFVLENANRYLARDPGDDDILAVFAGIRPLVRAGTGSDTAALSREHTVHISDAGLVTIAGGKWTTYRNMAEDCVDQAATIGDLPERPCVTRELRLHGALDGVSTTDALWVHGADAPELAALIDSSPALAAPIHARLPHRMGEVAWAVRHEMARTVDDVLARRTRSLLLDARAAIEAAPAVAAMMADELGRDDAWARRQVEAFTDLAAAYLVTGAS